MATQLEQRAVVFDEDVECRDLLIHTLEQLEIPVTAVSNFANFQAEVSVNTGLIILDLMMGDVDGVEVIRHLAAMQFRGRIVLVSRADQSVLDSAMKLAHLSGVSITGAFRKPFSPLLFQRHVSQYVHPQIKSTSRTGPMAQNEMIKLINSDALVAYYQPKLDLRSGKVAGVEALARVMHPTKGMLFPENFSTILASGEGALLHNQRMFERVFKDIAKWNAEGLNLPVAVNVSAATLDDISLPDQLADIAKQFGVALEQITIELTETSYSDEMLPILDVFTRLRLKGVGLSIDDFGTGYSTQERLANLPFTELKIDRSLIQALDHEMDATERVKRCVAAGRALGLTVVAEGVETARHIQNVRDLGVDLVQGYAVAKPMAADNITGWVAGSNKKKLLKSAAGQFLTLVDSS